MSKANDEIMPPIDKQSKSEGNDKDVMNEAEKDQSAIRVPQSVFQSLNAVRRLPKPRAAAEHCELCSVELSANHQHLVEPLSRKLLCACVPCAILFSNQGGKYKRVPQRIRLLESFQMSDAQWDSLLIPINMAFFFFSSPAGKIIAVYPSPAGPTESLLALEAWEEIVTQNPILQGLEADTEALLVKRIGSGRDTGKAEYYLVPIDKCYELTGLIRAHWRGLSGGTEVWQEIQAFFTGLKDRATVI